MDRIYNDVLIREPHYSLRPVKGNFKMILSLKPGWDLVGSVVVPCPVITSQSLS